jgi:two-component system chemotaxis response regulator CheB
MIKILAIDDSIIFRKVLQSAFNNSFEIKGIEVAEDAECALEILRENEFDVIICDFSMPNMNGVEFISELRRRKNLTQVILFTSALSSEITKALEAHQLGAIDYIVKPVSYTKQDPRKLILKTLMPYLNNVILEKRKNRLKVKRERLKGRESYFSIPSCLLFGASTGGPVVIRNILSKLKGMNIPILISLHMPDEFVTSFVKRLDELCEFSVKVAQIGDEVVPGICYVSRGGTSMIVCRKSHKVFIDYVDSPGPHGIYPSVDSLFESAAYCFNIDALAVILTGMGSDGLYGSGVLVDRGSTIINQNESSSTVYGMPRVVFEQNISSAEYSPDEIVDFFNCLFVRCRVKRSKAS